MRSAADNIAEGWQRDYRKDDGRGRSESKADGDP